jgi:ribosome-associated protein
VANTKPSKSARKREFLALQELGENLIDLKALELDSLGLDEELQNAVRAAQRMKSHGALRRQKQLIGKLMRQVDAEPIRAALNRLRADDLSARRVFAASERWRDRLVAEDPGAWDAFLSETGCDDTELKQLIAAPREIPPPADISAHSCHSGDTDPRRLEFSNEHTGRNHHGLPVRLGHHATRQ